MYRNLQDQINNINKKLRCLCISESSSDSPLVFIASLEGQPSGDATKLYIEYTSGQLYIWNNDSYESVGGTTQVPYIVFVDSIDNLPLPVDASVESIYVVRDSGVAYYSNGTSFLELNSNDTPIANHFAVEFTSFPTNAHLNNFVDQSSGTLTMSGSELVVGGTASVLTSNTINYPVDFMGENWTESCTIRATVSGASQVFGLGVRNTTTRAAAGTKKEISLSVDISSAGTKGLCTIFTGANGAFVSRASTAGNNLPINANDLIKLTLTRNGATVTGLIENLTQGVSRSLSYTYPIQSTSDPILPNTGRPCFYQLSQQDVNVLNFSFKMFPDYQDVTIDVLIHGDSKTEGYNTTANADRYSEQLKTAFSTKNIITIAGFGDETADTLKVLPHIIKAKPRIMVLAIGSNDVRNSVTDNTLYNNLLTIYNTCREHNIKVIFLGMGEAVISQANFWEKARAIFGEENCVFTYPALAGDNVHLTTAGHNTIAAALLAKLTPII